MSSSEYIFTNTLFTTSLVHSLTGTAMTLPVTTHTVTEDTAPHTQDTEEPILMPPMVDTAPKRLPQPAPRPQPEAKCAEEEERAEEAREAEEEVAGVHTKPIHNQAHVPISLSPLSLSLRNFVSFLSLSS